MKFGRRLEAKCPACGELNTVYDHPFFDQPKLGQLVLCTNCFQELEIINLNPIKLDWPLPPFKDDHFIDEEQSMRNLFFKHKSMF